MMEEINELIEQRIKKLDELKALGVEPFGGSFDIKDYAEDLINKHGSTAKEELEASPVQCVIAGRIIMMRDFGKAAFAHVQDSTAKIQIYFRKDILNEKYSVVKKLDIGDIIGISGKLFRTRTNELTIEVDDFTFLTKSLRPLPEKWHGLKDIETRYRQRYVDLIVNPEVKETFKKRSTIIKAVRDFLETKGFIEVETPMMHQIPGGAAARPFKTHHNALDIELYLRIAPELYLKRLLVGGYEKVYELNKNFRNEGISTKHNPEFSMLEFYIAYKDYNYLMSLTEELISYAAEKTLGTLKVSFGDEDIDFTPPWDRMPFLDSLTQKGVPADIMNDIDKAAAWAKANKIGIDKGASLGKVLDEIFKEKVEPYLIQPTFIIDYPVELSPLAKRKKDSPGLVERFELFIGGLEVGNAYSELNDPEEQRRRFEEKVMQNRPDLSLHVSDRDRLKVVDEDYVLALSYGMPPAGGLGIGIDRLVMLLTGCISIREVVLFPLLRPEKSYSQG